MTRAMALKAAARNKARKLAAAAKPKRYGTEVMNVGYSGYTQNQSAEAFDRSKWGQRPSIPRGIGTGIADQSIGDGVYPRF